MSGIRLRAGVPVLAGILLGCSLAFGQAQAPEPAGIPSDAPPSLTQSQSPSQAPGSTAPAAAPGEKSLTITSGSTMTKWKWQEVKVRWARQKGKWADCRAQAKEQKLRGPKSWHFVADCMIKVAHPQPAAADKSTH
jgi:hypothetical protein